MPYIYIMHGVGFLQDLAVVMIVAGVVSLIFHRLKQPVVLGYLVAGFIIGPFTPPFPLVQDQETVQTLADLGVVFLMFSLGLEFHFRKLQKVGGPAMLTAVFEITLMLLLGYEIGGLFGWGGMDRIFLGCILAISSTAIIVTTLRETNDLRSPYGQFCTGILIMEDIAVILMMVLLPGVARTGTLPTAEILVTILRLFVFLVGLIIVGLLLVPRLLRYVGKFKHDEMLLITVLALCFGTSLLAAHLEYSVALGAFVMGAIIAESRELGRVERLMAPVRDLFMAVFFVAIGMMIDPAHVVRYAVPVAVISVVFLFGKMFAVSVGAFLTGRDGRTSLKFGAGMAQLGEFAFVLAALGQALDVTSYFLYPVVAAVTAVNALVRPYLVDNAGRIADAVYLRLPSSLVSSLSVYNHWILRVGQGGRRNAAMKHVRSLVIQIVLTVTLMAAAFIATAFLLNSLPGLFTWVPRILGGPAALAWLLVVILLLPLYIAVVRKMQALAMMLSELAVSSEVEMDGSRKMLLRRLLSNTMFILQLVLLGMITMLVSAAMLPPLQVLAVLLVIVALMAAAFGQSFNKWYSRGKFALLETLSEPPIEEAIAEPPRPLPSLLKEAEMHTVHVRSPAVAGKLIRELELRSTTGASIVAIEREGRTMVNPGPDEELRVADKVLLLGNADQLAVAEAKLAGEE